MRSSKQRRLGAGRANRPLPHRELQEFGRPRADFVVCPSCGAVFDDKRWKAGFHLVRDARETKKVFFHLCPACAMVRQGQFEGEVVAIGVPERRIAETVARIESVGRTAAKRDPLDRIIRVSRRGRTIVVTTTENQLAVRVGKAVRAILGGRLLIRWSHEEDIVRVRWQKI